MCIHKAEWAAGDTGWALPSVMHQAQSTAHFQCLASRCTNTTVHVRQQLFTGERIHSCVLALSLQLPSVGTKSTGTSGLCNILAGRWCIKGDPQGSAGAEWAGMSQA